MINFPPHFFTHVACSVDQKDYMYDNYPMPWCRCQPYICGIITGFVLHRMRGKPLKIHWAMNLTVWVLAFITGLACIYGLDSWHIALTGVAPPAFNNAMYGVFQRLGWGASLCWLIFACAKGYGGMKTLLQHKWFFFVLNTIIRLFLCKFLAKKEVHFGLFIFFFYC